MQFPYKMPQVDHWQGSQHHTEKIFEKEEWIKLPHGGYQLEVSYTDYGKRMRRRYNQRLQAFVYNRRKLFGHWTNREYARRARFPSF